jgi:hypothetical protein
VAEYLSAPKLLASEVGEDVGGDGGEKGAVLLEPPPLLPIVLVLLLLLWRPLYRCNLLRRRLL